MRMFGTTTGPSGLALIALIIGSAACSAGTETRYVNGNPGDAPAAGDGTTSTEDGTTPDPSTTGDPTSKDTPAPPLVAGLAITDVAFFQAVKVPVVAAGKAVAPGSRNAPVVSNRPANVKGRFAMRACFMNLRTQPTDVELIMSEVLRLSRT